MFTGENVQGPGSISPHTSCQKLGCPPTSDISLLLISAKCPVCSSTATCPHALREVVQAVFSHASLLYNPHLLILWDSTPSLLLLVCIMVKLLKKKVD